MKFSYVYLLFFATTCLLQSMEIRVKSLKLDATLTINNEATVEDIKKELCKLEGIPVRQQTLHVVTKGWFSKKINPYSLPNAANIKKIVNNNKTNVFQLCIHAQPQS